MRRIWGGGGAGGLGVNDVLMKDARLSVPARGLAVHLLLLPDRARPDRRRLAARPGESADSIEGYLRELEDAGYVRRRIVWDRRGRAFEEVTVHARAVEGEAGEVAGRVFHWLASADRVSGAAASAEREGADEEGEAGGAAEATADVTADVTADATVDVTADADADAEPVVEEERRGESEPEAEPQPASRSESEPVAAGSGSARGSASVSP